MEFAVYIPLQEPHVGQAENAQAFQIFQTHITCKVFAGIFKHFGKTDTRVGFRALAGSIERRK